jgi:hypothetical protein
MAGLKIHSVDVHLKEAAPMQLLNELNKDRLWEITIFTINVSME